MRTFTAVAERDPQTKLLVGYVPGFSGAHSQGATLEELRENLRRNLSRCFIWRCTGVAAWLLFGSGFFSLTAATLPAGFTESQWGFGMSGAPTAMAFAPDGRLFVCLQDGRLRVIDKNGVLLA